MKKLETALKKTRLALLISLIAGATAGAALIGLHAPGKVEKEKRLVCRVTAANILTSFRIPFNLQSLDAGCDQVLERINARQSD